MKVFALLFLVFGLALTSNSQSQNAAPFASKIATELNKNQTLHTLDSWLLDEVKGVNKMQLVLEAVKYNNSKSTVVLKGLKLELIPEAVVGESATKLSSKQLVAFIDDTEYSEVMVIINQMITDFTKAELSKKQGIMTYTTKSGVKFGFIFKDKKEVGFISILSSDAEIACEFANIEKFLTEFRNYIDICAKDLYLPENAEKLKKAKKSNQEAKDVNVEDI